MFESLWRSVVGRFNKNQQEAEPDELEGEVPGSDSDKEAPTGQEAKTPLDNQLAGEDAAAKVGASRRTTSYLPAALAAEPKDKATEDALLAEPPTEAEPDSDSASAVDWDKTLNRAVRGIPEFVLALKKLVIDLVAALPDRISDLRGAVEQGNHAQVAALAWVVSEQAAVLGDDLISQATDAAKVLGRCKQYQKQRESGAARSLVESLEAEMAALVEIVTTKRRAVETAGENLARASLAKNFQAMATSALVLCRDCALLAFLENGVLPVAEGPQNVSGQLDDRILRLQQALIAQEFRGASRLSRELAVQAGIMADPSVKIAVTLIANARKLRELGKTLGPVGQEQLRDSSRRLVQALPGLTSRLDERLADLATQAEELGVAAGLRDYPAIAGLSYRMALTGYVATHGIVSRAASLLTVTGALEEAVRSGRLDALEAMLESM